MLDFLKVIFLSLIEAITEFLPISSTTHLMIADIFLKTGLTKNDFFLIFIQLGSLFALFFYYRSDIKKIFVETFQLKKEGYIPFFSLLNAFIVSGLLGIVFKKFGPKLDFIHTAYILISIGVVMILLTKKQSRGSIENLYEISPLRAFFIGIAQAFSVFPGVSRLGITLVFGILLGIEKKNAIKFSFLLGLPTMFAGSIYEIISLYHSGNSPYLTESISAFFLTFSFSLVFINILIKILINVNIKFFGYYRIILGTLLLLMIQFGKFF